MVDRKKMLARYRKRTIAVLAAAVLGVTALMVFERDKLSILDDDEEDGQSSLIKELSAAKVSLQQGLAVSEQEGQPISGKFELEEGILQLSLYTVKDGKFSEVLVDYTTGKVASVKPITEGEDLTAANSQNAAMAKAKKPLKETVDIAMAKAMGFRAVSVAPDLKDGHPVASVLLLKEELMQTINEPLE
jgi:hypothetical protein